MALIVNSQPLLNRPSLRALLAFQVIGSYPLKLPYTYGSENSPVRVSSSDEYPPSLGAVLFKKGLIGDVRLNIATADPFGGIQRMGELSVNISKAADPALATLMQDEMRGKLAVLHLWDKETDELQEAVFSGGFSACLGDLHTWAVTFGDMNFAKLGDAAPRRRITLTDFPNAPRDGAPSGGLGDVIPIGWGVASRIPGRYCQAWTGVTPSKPSVDFTATAATDTLTVPGSNGHGFMTGDPIAVSSSATLPAGLSAIVRYYAIRITVNTFKLALTIGNAFAGVPVDITSTGSGVHTADFIAADVPNPVVYEYVLGVGDLSVDLVWRKAVPERADIINDPTQYEVLPGSVSVDGRYCTVVRMTSPLVDGSGPMAFTADVQRVTPDWDDFCRAAWKFKSTFRGDSGIDLRQGTYSSPVTTANLVAGTTGVGLGACRLDGIGQYLEAPPAKFREQSFTIEMWGTLDTLANSVALCAGPLRALGDQTSYYVQWNDVTGHFNFQCSGNSDSPILSGGTTVAGQEHYVVGTRDSKTGAMRLYVDGALVASGTHAVPMAYSNTSHGFIRGASHGPTSAFGFLAGTVGYTRFSAVARDARYVKNAWWMMRRNGIEFLREILTDEIGDFVNPVTFDQAAIDWDNIPNPSVGGLKLDGFITEATTAQAIIEQILAFRDIRLWRNADGLIDVQVAKPATNVVAQFGHGDQFNNIVEFKDHGRVSSAEAIRQQPIHYRVKRDVNGQASGYQFTDLIAEGLPVGRVEEPLELPLVYDHETADIRRDWHGKRLRSRDEQFVTTLAHEARRVQIGEIGRVSIVAANI